LSPTGSIFSLNTGVRPRTQIESSKERSRLTPVQAPTKFELAINLKTAKTLGIGTFTQALYDEAKKGGWTVVSMKNDWERNFPFE
jgi:hypothetical protein